MEKELTRVTCYSHHYFQNVTVATEREILTAKSLNLGKTRIQEGYLKDLGTSFLKPVGQMKAQRF